MNWEAELPLLVGGVDGDGDWNDVVRRAGRLERASRRRHVSAGAAALLAAAFLASPAFGLGSWYDALFGGAAPTQLVVDRLGGGRCRLEQAGRAVATIPCAGPQFAPTAVNPLHDFSRYGPQRRVSWLAGAAAPGVAAVALLTTDGRLVARTAVTDGFYARTDGLPSDAVEAVVALDRAGKPLACLPRSAPHCPVGTSSSKGGRS